MENTKNAVSIELVVSILEGEVNRAYESMLSSERLYNFERTYENATKKTIAFWKKQVLIDSKKWSVLSQNLFVFKKELGIK